MRLLAPPKAFAKPVLVESPLANEPFFAVPLPPAAFPGLSASAADAPTFKFTAGVLLDPSVVVFRDSRPGFFSAGGAVDVQFARPT